MSDECRLHRSAKPYSWLVCVCVVFASACGYASIVRRDAYGGTLALHGSRGSAMDDAERYMAAHCGPNYSVVQEENVVVGQQTFEERDYSESNEFDSNQGSEQATSTTTDVTEYRLSYRCAGTPPAPASNTAGSSSSEPSP